MLDTIKNAKTDDNDFQYKWDKLTFPAPHADSYDRSYKERSICYLY